MTPPEDPRVAIVRRWLGEDNPYERADQLLAELDAVRCAQSLDAEPTEEDVERVACARGCVQGMRFPEGAPGRVCETCGGSGSVVCGKEHK